MAVPIIEGSGNRYGTMAMAQKSAIAPRPRRHLRQCPRVATTPGISLCPFVFAHTHALRPRPRRCPYYVASVQAEQTSGTGRQSVGASQTPIAWIVHDVQEAKNLTHIEILRQGDGLRIKHVVCSPHSLPLRAHSNTLCRKTAAQAYPTRLLWMFITTTSSFTGAPDGDPRSSFGTVQPDGHSLLSLARPWGNMVR
ncbi:hypothetical protein BS50DRAFT_142291 [Corynespora cassiicola Philippines]|uniref:Uncharacterized protein n=1 Tax=Corynespora cassiicola Philippines TaxID=1448308 RepID=A0A2T2NA54_CORCC|nr:hypothetical protein BS50DRAFT_142291 [Corynespora cassiicola Philippines]